MTNENLAVISAIKSFKRESDVFKQVINKLVNENADENLIILLLNPDLVDKIIESDKYSEALDYLMHTYQVERSLIIKEQMLKRYEKKVQGAIEEAKISSVPTKEAIESAFRGEDDIKKAKDAAKTFENSPEKTDALSKNKDLVNSNNANAKVKKGASEIAESLDPGFKEAKKASEEFTKKHEGVKANVEVPHVTLTPENKIDKPKVEPKKDEKEQSETPVVSTLSPAAKTTGELDNKMHEVKKTRKVSEFFKKHKKGILIATGIAMVAVTSAVFSPILVPTLISANSVCASLATSAAIKNLFTGLNTVLAKTIGATFMNSQWLTSTGAAITSTVAKGGLLTALGTYGLFGVYGFGFVKAIKGMFKAIDLPSKKELEEIENVEQDVLKEVPEKEDLTVEKQIVKEEVKTETTSIPTEEELRSNAPKTDIENEQLEDTINRQIKDIPDIEGFDPFKNNRKEEFVKIPTEEELRANAPKKVDESPISLKNDDELGEEISIEPESTLEEVEDVASMEEKEGLMSRLLEPESDKMEPISVEPKEDIDIPLDDNLSAADFEMLIKELQANNAAKREREKMDAESLDDYSLGMGL